METLLKWFERLSPLAYFVLLAALAAIGMTAGTIISYLVS